MREQQVDLVWCGRWKWNTECNRIPGHPVGNSVTNEQLFIKRCGIGGSNILIKKDVYIQLGGFDETLLIFEDRDFLARFLKQNYSFYVIPNRLINQDDTPHARLTQVSTDRITSMHLFYKRYSEEMDTKIKKLYRSRTDKILFGVCGGIAQYFHIDASLVRLLFVLLTFASGLGIVLYIIGAIIIPEEPTLSTTGEKNDDST